MSLTEQIQKDIVTAMKAKDEARLSTLRMVKSALQLKQVEKMAPLDDKESQAVLATLIKQRKESVEQFTKGGRQEMADKEAAEIVLIETYMPKAAGEAEIVAGVKAAIAEMGSAHDERNGHSDEERHGEIQRRRHESGWEDGERDREERVSGEIVVKLRLGLAIVLIAAVAVEIGLYRAQAPVPPLQRHPDAKELTHPRNGVT